jgi:dCTP deaminase
MVLADWIIRNYCTNPAHYENWGPLISPYVDASKDKDAISFGLTSTGYDIRLGLTIYKFKNDSGLPIDPKRFKDKEYVKLIADEIQLEAGKPYSLPPYSYILGTSFETFRMPRFLNGICLGKSTYARSGIVVNTTPLEPDWLGDLTIEIGNVTPCHVLLYPLEGIAQLQFQLIQGEVKRSYADKKGKYQGQKGVTLPRMKE